MCHMAKLDAMRAGAARRVSPDRCGYRDDARTLYKDAETILMERAVAAPASPLA